MIRSLLLSCCGRKALLAATALSISLIGSSTLLADEYYVTDFTKTNSIYTDLNQEFPNTGPGVPGSGVGTPNSTFHFDPATYTSPNAVSGSNYANNGTTFMLASNSTGQDFDEIGSGTNPVFTLGQNGATAVHTIMGAYVGSTIDVTFTGSLGATETFNSIYVPDFYNGPTQNSASAVNGSTTNNLFDQTVFQVQNSGGGATGNTSNGWYGTYDITEQTYILDPDFAGQTLASMTISPEYNTALLYAITVDAPASTPASDAPEPASLLLLGLGALPIAAYARHRATR